MTKCNYDDTINYNVDDYGVLRVYRGNAILLESEDWLSTPRDEIERFIDENLWVTEREDTNTYVVTDKYLNEQIYDRDSNRWLYTRCPSKNEKDKKRAEMNKEKQR